jgi:T-complex protein 1 subunit alpha
MILEAGANVVLTTKGIDDLCLKYFVEKGAMAVRRVRKEDLRRIAKATGGEICLSLASLNEGEAFEPSMLGHAKSVSVERVCDDELIVIRQPQKTSAASVILRGANDFLLDEMERAVHDSLCVVKRALESKVCLFFLFFLSFFLSSSSFFFFLLLLCVWCQ